MSSFDYLGEVMLTVGQKLSNHIKGLKKVIFDSSDQQLDEIRDLKKKVHNFDMRVIRLETDLQEALRILKRIEASSDKKPQKPAPQVKTKTYPKKKGGKGSILDQANKI